MAGSGFTFPVTGGAIIGDPYQGTHAKAFNVQGGSDNWESENAVDIAVPVGTPVYAVAAGIIGPQFGPDGTGRFAGIRLHLNSGADSFYYAHLSGTAPGISPGVRVKAGQLLGYSGSANGVAHLHFASTTNLNPLDIVKGLPSKIADAAAGANSDTTSSGSAAADGSSSSGVPPAVAAATGCGSIVAGAIVGAGVLAGALGWWLS